MSAGLPAPVPCEQELVEMIADAVFTPAAGYASQLKACNEFERIHELLKRLTQQMLDAPSRDDAETVKLRIQREFLKQSIIASNDLDAYAREEADAAERPREAMFRIED